MGAFETLGKSRVEFGRVLAELTGDQWELPTPCDEWNVRQLVNHVLGGNVRYEMLLRGATPDEVNDTRSMDHIGDDALASYDALASAVVAAFEQPGALERTVHHPAGDRTGLDLLWLRVADWTIHGWDLARATGGDEALDPELVASLLQRLTEHGTGLPTGGYYKEPTTDAAAEAEAQTRLLLLVGRHP